MKQCKRCGRQSHGYEPSWVFKDGGTICEPCHEELMAWLEIRALMLEARGTWP